MNKWISALLCLCMLFINALISISAEPADTAISVPDMEFGGLRLDPDDFRFAFVGDTADCISLAECNSRSVVFAEMTQLSINGCNISFVLRVTRENEADLLQYFSGELCWGANHQSGKNSITVRFHQPKGRAVLEPVLFNIYNDSGENDLLVEPALTGQPHLKFYVKDQQGRLLLFETALDNALLVQGNDEWAEYGSDLSWFWPYVGARTTEEPLTEEAKQLLGLPTTSSRALNSYSSWMPATMYRKETIIGGEPVVCLSSPCIQYLHRDVFPGSQKWEVLFWVAETTNKNGHISYGVTPFEYRNLQISISLGSYTYLDSICREGCFFADRDAIEGFSRVASALISVAKLVSPGVRSLAFVADALNQVHEKATYWLTTKTVNINTKAEVDNKTAAHETFNGYYYGVYSEMLDEDYFLNTHTNKNGVAKSGHYYHFFLLPTYLDEQNRTAETTGELTVSFDFIDTSHIFDPDFAPTPVDLGTIELPYIASARP